MALKAMFNVMPVDFSQATTVATSAAVICTSAGTPGADPAATPCSAAGHVKSTGLVAAGVHWYCELHSLSAMNVSSTDRKSVVYGKSVDLGGRRIIKKK